MRSRTGAAAWRFWLCADSAAVRHAAARSWLIICPTPVVRSTVSEANRISVAESSRKPDLGRHLAIGLDIRSARGRERVDQFDRAAPDDRSRWRQTAAPLWERPLRAALCIDRPVLFATAVASVSSLCPTAAENMTHILLLMPPVSSLGGAGAATLGTCSRHHCSARSLVHGSVRFTSES